MKLNTDYSGFDAELHIIEFDNSLYIVPKPKRSKIERRGPSGVSRVTKVSGSGGIANKYGWEIVFKQLFFTGTKSSAIRMAGASKSNWL